MPQQPGNDWQDYTPSTPAVTPAKASVDGGWQDYETAKSNVTKKQKSTPTTKEQISSIMGGKKWEELPLKTKMQVLTLGFGQKAQDYANQAFGPESQGKGVLDRAWNELKSLFSTAGETAMKPIAGLSDPKTAAVAASGVVAPEIPAVVFGVEAGRDLPGRVRETQKHPTPGNVQDLLLTGSQLLAAPAGARGTDIEKATTMPQESTPIGKAAARAVRGTLGFGPDVTREGVTKVGEKHIEAVEDAKAKQAAENAKTEAANRQAIEKHASERRETILGNEDAQARHLAEVENVRHENEQAQARAMDEYRAEVRRVQETNQAAQDQVSERGRLARQVEQQSQQLGEGIQQAAREANAEGNRRYNAVQEAIGDRTRPLDTLAGAVNNAKQNTLRTPENIKIFGDVLKAAESDTDTAIISGNEVTRDQVNETTWQQLVDAGIVGGDQGAKFSFFQGVYTKTSKLLAKGTLPGDVYQAVNSVNEVAGREMQAMARESGPNVEAQLADAQAYWKEYKQTFYDKDSAVAQVLKRVGKLDPGYYSEPFISGKAAQRGITNLQRFNPELARLAESAKQTHEQMSSLPKSAKVTPEPALPKTTAKAEPAPPELKELPQKPEMKAPKKIEQPGKPEIDLREAKMKEVDRLRKVVRGMSRYDLNRLTFMGLGALTGFMGGHEGGFGAIGAAAGAVGAEALYFGARRALAVALDKPAVVEWLTRPQPGDVDIIRQLPPEIKNAVRVEFGDIAAQQASHNPQYRLPREIQQFLNEQPDSDEKKKKKSSREEIIEQGEALTK